MRARIMALSVVLAAGTGVARLGGQPAFDKLGDADRKALQERFEREVWPLLARHGKDGCVGCHHARSRSLPKFSGEPGGDFRMLLREGFFLHDDPGNLVTRVASRDKRTRMPPGDRPAWTPEEVEVLRRFTRDVDAKQKR